MLRRKFLSFLCVSPLGFLLSSKKQEDQVISFEGCRLFVKDGYVFKKIDKTGGVCYFNKSSELHREDGPAVEYPNGLKMWYKNGLVHCEDGPAIEFANGTKWWYKEGRYIPRRNSVYSS